MLEKDLNALRPIKNQSENKKLIKLGCMNTRLANELTMRDAYNCFRAYLLSIVNSNSCSSHNIRVVYELRFKFDNYCARGLWWNNAFECNLTHSSFRFAHLMHQSLSTRSLHLSHFTRIIKYAVIHLSYTPRTLRACRSQSEFRIVKIRESSASAFFYNCTPNT